MGLHILKNRKNMENAVQIIHMILENFGVMLIKRTHVALHLSLHLVCFGHMSLVKKINRVSNTFFKYWAWSFGDQKLIRCSLVASWTLPIKKHVRKK